MPKLSSNTAEVDYSTKLVKETADEKSVLKIIHLKDRLLERRYLVRIIWSDKIRVLGSIDDNDETSILCKGLINQWLSKYKHN